MKVFQVSGKASQVFKIINLMAKYRGKETLSEIIKKESK